MLRAALWNLLIAAIVFVPVCSIGMLISEGPVFPEDEWVQEASGAFLMIALAMSVLVAVGVLAYTVALLPFQVVAKGRYLRPAAALLAPLLPLVPLALRMQGGQFFSIHLGATMAATLAYGLAASAWWMRVAKKRDVFQEPSNQ